MGKSDSPDDSSSFAFWSERLDEGDGGCGPQGMVVDVRLLANLAQLAAHNSHSLVFEETASAFSTVLYDLARHRGHNTVAVSAALIRQLSVVAFQSEMLADSSDGSIVPIASAVHPSEALPPVAPLQSGEIIEAPFQAHGA